MRKKKTLTEEAGSPAPWWDTVISLIVTRPDIGGSELAKIVGKSRQAIHFLRGSERFQEMLEHAQTAHSNLPKALEAVAAFQESADKNHVSGVKFIISRGQIENRMRELIMAAANDTSEVPVLDREGNDTGARVPAISAKEKWDLANKTLGVFRKSNTTIVGKQTNNLNVGVGTGNLDDELPPALAEMMELVKSSVPMKRIENKDGSVEFKLDMKNVTPVEVEQ